MNHDGVAHYELSLVLSDSDDYNTILTYYDGGAEPPYGGVRAPELPEDVDFTINQASFLVKATHEWINRVVEIMKPGTTMIRCASPDLDMETRMWLDGDDLKLRLISETLDSEFVYISADSKIIMKARDAFDLSWCGLLYYHETLEIFLRKVK